MVYKWTLQYGKGEAYILGIDGTILATVHREADGAEAIFASALELLEVAEDAKRELETLALAYGSAHTSPENNLFRINQRLADVIAKARGAKPQQVANQLDGTGVV